MSIFLPTQGKPLRLLNAMTHFFLPLTSDKPTSLPSKQTYYVVHAFSIIMVSKVNNSQASAAQPHSTLLLDDLTSYFREKANAIMFRAAEAGS